MIEEYIPTILAGAITLGSIVVLKLASGGRDLLFNYYTPYGQPYRFLRGSSVDEAKIEASKYVGKIKMIEKVQSGCFLYRGCDLNERGLQKLGPEEITIPRYDKKSSTLSDT